MDLVVELVDSGPGWLDLLRWLSELARDKEDGVHSGCQQTCSSKGWEPAMTGCHPRCPCPAAFRPRPLSAIIPIQ